MPFKLKLKKSKQYNVVSKNLFVISVELLDNTNVECTLLANSIGLECLSNVCQRLGLQQLEYFGLRFKSKQGNLRWVDLERPLKKQLDKYAQETYLYLGVMFYVADVHLLHDEVTRYHYFLQLKTDIIESRLQCTEDDAILLASYSLQAEFGDHDPERHTTEYLNNFVLLPKRLTMEKEARDALMERVIHTHRSLLGLSPSLAEVYYIMQAQQLDGYGQECFHAKDSNGTELLIGASLLGIFIKQMNGQPTSYFKWSEIMNLVHHKKYFGMECHLTERTVQFQMEDSEWAKYVWKMCVLQHRFYSKNRVVSSIPGGQEASLDHGRLLATNAIEGRFHYTNENPAQTSGLGASQESLDEEGVYSTNLTNREAANIRNAQEGAYPEDLREVPKEANFHLVESEVQPPHLYSSSQLVSDVSQMHPSPVTMSRSEVQMVLHGQSARNLDAYSPEDHLSIETRKALLPHYRQAPDYETAVRHKYGETQGAEIASSGDHLVRNASVAANTVVEPGHPMHQSALPVQSYAHYKNFTDLSNIENNEMLRETMHESHLNARAAAAGILLPPVHTYSTPELASQGLSDAVSDQALASMHLYYQYKPPPPYPYNQRSSSSTPDLSSSQVLSAASSNGIPKRDQEMRHAAIVDPSSHHVSRLGSEPILYAQHPHYQMVPEGVLVQAFNKEHRTSYDSQAYHVVSSHLSSVAEGAASHQNVSNYNHPLTTTASSTNVLNPIVTVTGSGSELHTSAGVIPTCLRTSQMQGQAISNVPSQIANCSALTAGSNRMQRQDVNGNEEEESQDSVVHLMGPMLVAAMNGLTLSRPEMVLQEEEDNRNPRDARVRALENKLADGQVFVEFEQIPKKKNMANFTTALLPENMPRNRFKDVLPYEENRVRLTPTKENRTGYINASHVTVSVGTSQKFYIATQGPLVNTVQNFWQMVWEHHVQLIVMLTDVQEQGREKCYPYWPQENKNGISIRCGDFQITRNFSMESSTYVTTSLTLYHTQSRTQRPVWHIQYTDWPDHGCPVDFHGFLSFMEEIDAVKRLAQTEHSQGRGQNSPVVVHCSAGVGRSGVVILCDILLYSVDHNEIIDVPKILTQLRYQRMLTVQTLAQYKFVYAVLIQHLRNSRLI